LGLVITLATDAKRLLLQPQKGADEVMTRLKKKDGVEARAQESDDTKPYKMRLSGHKEPLQWREMIAASGG